MQVVVIDQVIPCEVVDKMFKSLSSKKMSASTFVDFSKEVNKMLPDDILDSSVNSYIMLTMSGNYQQKIVFCADREKRSVESIRQLFYSLYGEVFTEGSDRTMSAWVKHDNKTFSVFGIITDRVENVMMFE